MHERRWASHPTEILLSLDYFEKDFEKDFRLAFIGLFLMLHFYFLYIL